MINREVGINSMIIKREVVDEVIVKSLCLLFQFPLPPSPVFSRLTKTMDDTMDDTIDHTMNETYQIVINPQSLTSIKPK